MSGPFFHEWFELNYITKQSKVLHVGNVRKCDQPCPALKVHKEIMQKADSFKYLGNIITLNGSNHATVKDRRNKGWEGKVAQIMGILGEVEIGAHRMEIVIKKSNTDKQSAFLCRSLVGSYGY